MKISTTLPLSLLMVSSLSYATNGYFTHGKSIPEKAQAGAGVAQINTNFGLNLNPAQINSNEQKSGFEIGGVVFSPSRKYQVTGQPSVPVGTFCSNQCPFSLGDGNQVIKSDNDIFFIPQFGVRYQLDDVSHLNFSVLANGGMNTEYGGGTAQLAPQGTSSEFAGTFGNGTTGVDLAQIFTMLTYSRNVLNNDLAIGASVFYAYQQIEYKITPALNLGATYQGKVSMSRFDDYAGLFAQQGKFDIPSSWTVGFAYHLTESSELLFDFQSISYGEVDSIANSIDQLTNGSCMPTAQGGVGTGCLGGDQGAGFGWADMDIYKLAYKVNYSDKLILRAGISKTDQPIAKNEVLFAILTPAVIEYHYTLGASYQFTPHDGLHLSLMYAPENSLSGKNTFDPNQKITVSMSQLELGFSYQGSW